MVAAEWRGGGYSAAQGDSDGGNVEGRVEQEMETVHWVLISPVATLRGERWGA